MQTVYNLGVVKQRVRNTPDMSSYYTKKEVDQLMLIQANKLNAIIDDLYSELQALDIVIDELNNRIEELENQTPITPPTPDVQLFILDNGILNTMILG